MDEIEIDGPSASCRARSVLLLLVSVYCPYIKWLQREVLKKVSPELDLKILFNTKMGLDAVANLLDSLPQLLC